MNSSYGLVAFIDESRKPLRHRKTGKPDHGRLYYVTAAAVLFRGDLEECRSALLRAEAGLGFDLHYSDLKSSTRRRTAVDAIAAVGDWEGYFYELAGPISGSPGAERKARFDQLSQAFQDLENVGVSHATLETRNRAAARNMTLDERDRALVVKLRQAGKISDNFEIAHSGKDEPMLKIADVLASSRTDLLCAKDESIFPRLAHRVTIVTV